jgi:GAF domain-containing protein
MASERTHPRDAERALEQLGGLTLREVSMETLLQSVADAAKGVVPGNSEASVSVMIGTVPTTAVSTGPLALDCDESQYGHGSGPCLHAATTGELTEIADAQAETRWRDYVEQAAERGALSSLSVPLPMMDEVLSGALNIYARRPNAFDEKIRSVAIRLAPYAAVAVAHTQAYQRARRLAIDPPEELEARPVIDEAKAVLMKEYRLTGDQAVQTLTGISIRARLNLGEVAHRLIAGEELPGLPPLHRGADAGMSEGIHGRRAPAAGNPRSDG